MLESGRACEGRRPIRLVIDRSLRLDIIQICLPTFGQVVVSLEHIGETMRGNDFIWVGYRSKPDPELLQLYSILMATLDVRNSKTFPELRLFQTPLD